jgi:2'-5' RNA ligase
MPADEDRAFFQEMINALARHYDAPPFVPHVTIYSGASAPADNPRQIIITSTQAVRAVTLDVDAVLSSEQFTKTLYVQFHPSTPLRSLSERMKRAVAQPSDYVLNPHLSLMYKDLSADEKQRIAASIHLPQAEVSFSEVWAIASPGHTQTPEDIRQWDVVCRWPLSQ